jgi:hypothetical protein
VRLKTGLWKICFRRYQPDKLLQVACWVYFWEVGCNSFLAKGTSIATGLTRKYVSRSFFRFFLGASLSIVSRNGSVVNFYNTTSVVNFYKNVFDSMYFVKRSSLLQHSVVGCWKCRRRGIGFGHWFVRHVCVILKKHLIKVLCTYIHAIASNEFWSFGITYNISTCAFISYLLVLHSLHV